MTQPPDLGLVDGMVQLSFAVQEVLGSVAAERDVSVAQVRLLGVLRDRQPTMLELARLLSLEKSSVTGLVDRAEQRGLVRRTRGTQDGRAIHVQLTPAGRRLTLACTKQMTERIAALCEDLSPRDRQQFATTAAQVVGRHASDRGIDLSAGMR